MKKLLLLFSILATAISASAENYILYTSTDGNVVTPDRSAVFNTNVVSNTYENGQGKIVFDDELTIIGNYSFFWCRNLKSIEIPGSVTEIGDWAFYNCEKLSSINIPNSVKKIGRSSFEACHSLPVEDHIRYADTYLVGTDDSNQVTYKIKEGTRWIGYNAFKWCDNLTSIEIPNSVFQIDQAFFGCENLKEIVLSENHPYFTTIDGVLLNKEKTQLVCFPVGHPQTEYIIPNMVTEIGISSFRNCINLKSVIIPETVKTISETAFQNCQSLTSIEIPSSVELLGSSAFAACIGLTSVNLPDSDIDIKSDVFNYCTSLPVEGNLRYADNFLVEAVDKSFSSYKIKEGTRWINQSIFYACKDIKYISIPKSVKVIGGSAFSDCI